MHRRRDCCLGCALLLLATGAQAADPESGWWWNPAEPGRGWFLELQGGRLFVAAFNYADGGRSDWTVALMDADASGAYAGTLNAFRDGQTLDGAWRANSRISPDPGSIRIEAQDARHARLTWPGGVVPIERLELRAGGLTAPRPAGTPETGWWWNPDEPGRGFGVEIQGDTMFLGGFFYDDTGAAQWRVSGAAPMAAADRYQNAWLLFADGQPMLGSFRPARLLDASATLRLDFATALDATLTLPGGRQTALTRMVYASRAEIAWSPALTLASVPAGSVGGEALASSTRLVASWAAATTPGVDRYVLRVVDLGDGSASATTTTQLSATLSGLKSDSAYRVELTACSAARCYLTQGAQASARTPAEVWQLQGSGNSVAGLRRVVADGNVKIHALRYGADAPAALAGRVQAWYGPMGGPTVAGLAVAAASAPASAAAPDSYLALTSLAGSSGLIRPASPAPLVADVATGQAVPLAAALGGKLRLYFEAQGSDGRTRILSLDAADGYAGRDFNRGAAGTCSSAADYGPGGGCEPTVVIAVDGDAGGNPRIRDARQFKIGVRTADDWRWDGAPGSFMWFTVDQLPGCSNANRNHVYALWDGSRFVVQYDAAGCPRHLAQVQAGHPLHLGGARFKFYYGDTSDLSAALPGSNLPFLGPKRVLYADGARSGLPDALDFGDWDATSAGRSLRFLWPNGETLSDRDEGYIDDFSVLTPTGEPGLQLMYVAITDGRIAPLMAAAVLRNP